MKVTVNINGKKKLRIRDKKLTDKLRHIFATMEENTNKATKDNYLIPALMPVPVLEEDAKATGDPVMEGRYIDRVKREVNNIYEKPEDITNRETISSQTMRGQYLNAVMDVVNIAEKDNSNSQSSMMAKNNSAENISQTDNYNKSAEDGSTPAHVEAKFYHDRTAGGDGERNTFYDELNGMDTKVKTFAQSAGTSFKTMWDELISGGRKAKDPWDAIWLSLRNTAWKRISEMLKIELFGDLFSSGKKEGASFGLLGTIISGVAGLFTGGASGIISKAGAASFSTDKADTINNLNNYSAVYPAGSELTSMFRKYADAAENWQREIRVVNDLFENNRGIKAVQDYLSKIKS